MDDYISVQPNAQRSDQIHRSPFSMSQYSPDMIPNQSVHFLFVPFFWLALVVLFP